MHGITITNKRSFEELYDLCCKAHEIGIEWQDEEEQTRESNIMQKLTMPNRKLPLPFLLKSDWTTDSSFLPNHTWGHACIPYVHNYLIVKEGFNHKPPKAYKSLEGFRLHWDQAMCKIFK